MTLEISGVRKAFGGNVVISGTTLAPEKGLITSLVGPNGAGKTTLFNLITGFLRPDEGEIRYQGRSLIGLKPQKITAMGLARSFQSLRLFTNMTVFENVLVSQENSLRPWQRNRQHHANAEAVLKRVGLLAKRHSPAADLSYAEKKFLSLARLMALGAQLYLLDEPASGLDGPSRVAFQQLLRSLQEEGHTILLIEHNLDIVREVSDRIAFLNQGVVAALGTPEEIFSNQELTQIYFGISA